jgi:hypothetical protein
MPGDAAAINPALDHQWRNRGWNDAEQQNKPGRHHEDNPQQHQQQTANPRPQGAARPGGAKDLSVCHWLGDSLLS